VSEFYSGSSFYTKVSKVVGYYPVPRYVLKDGVVPSGPVVLSDAADGTAIVAVYGFPNKLQYDQFHSQSLRLITPYPLVIRYLQSQIDLDDHSLRLIILDAISPLQEIVYAATMQSVLDAINAKLDSVEATHRLSLDTVAAAYQAQPISAPSEKR